jgi:TetR/AcrR family transcriptional regulator
MTSALKLLRRRGYRHVRVEDVAEDAGVCKATVYHYFANKDDLLTRSVAHRMAERTADIERQLASAGGSASERLRLFLHDFWTNALTPQTALWQRLIVGEMAKEAPDVFAAWARGLVQRWRLVETLIKDGQKSGEFRKSADAAVTARMILSGLTHQALFHAHFNLRRFAPCSLDRLFDSSMDQLLHGLRAPASRSKKR